MFLITLDFCEGKLFRFKVLSEFECCVLVIFCWRKTEEQARGQDILAVPRFPWGKVGTRGDVEGRVPSIDKFSSKLEL